MKNKKLKLGKGNISLWIYYRPLSSFEALMAKDDLIERLAGVRADGSGYGMGGKVIIRDQSFTFKTKKLAQAAATRIKKNVKGIRRITIFDKYGDRI
jgi:hypothetical protein